MDVVFDDRRAALQALLKAGKTEGLAMVRKSIGKNLIAMYGAAFARLCG
jgi:hypothetical protein